MIATSCWCPTRWRRLTDLRIRGDGTAMQETIAAIATGAGASGVGIVRLSGPRAVELVAEVVGLSVEQLGREVRYAVARGKDGERLDDVLVFAMRAPRSFTGEDVAEIQGHGGAVNLSRLLRAVLERGARAAQPGEFSRRAFDNGKLDLLRAEGLLGVIEAGSERGWRIAQAQLAGALGRGLEALEDRARKVLAEIEGALDFPEEALDEQSSRWLGAELGALTSSCEALARSYQAGSALRNGITVALVGAVNVGKSSLLNAFAGRPRALVSEQPGTTRDYVEAQVEWDGVQVTLIDTAGWRESGDVLERSGMELGKERAAEADVVLVVSDGIAPWPVVEHADRTLYVRSKADQARPDESLTGCTESEALVTSALTGAGLREGRQRVLELVGVAETVGEGELLVTERQRSLAEGAARAFSTAQRLLASQPRELVAYDIREGYKALMDMRGTAAEDQVVSEIFARFCIGK